MKTVERQQAEVAAYYRGRNSVWNGTGRKKEVDASLQAEFDAGRRHAQAEERLDADTEWDADYAD